MLSLANMSRERQQDGKSFKAGSVMSSIIAYVEHEQMDRFRRKFAKGGYSFRNVEIPQDRELERNCPYREKKETYSRRNHLLQRDRIVLLAIATEKIGSIFVSVIVFN